MVAVILSRALRGVEAALVTVEVHLANGLPAFHLVGLPEAEVREARDRVRAALQNSRFEFPARRITVNLAPADLPKASGRFDLPIALGILAATAQIPATALAHFEFAGELALDGALRGIRGALPMVLCAQRDGRAFVLPAANADEAALVPGARIHPARTLLEVCAHVSGRAPIATHVRVDSAAVRHVNATDLSDVRGQAHAKRALEVAAAGGHSLLLIGPPGAGKSMLAQRLPGILPHLSDGEALEPAAVASLSGRFDVRRWRERPFRAPHHTASAIALVGGGCRFPVKSTTAQLKTRLGDNRGVCPASCPSIASHATGRPIAYTGPAKLFQGRLTPVRPGWRCGFKTLAPHRRGLWSRAY